MITGKTSGKKVGIFPAGNGPFIGVAVLFLLLEGLSACRSARPLTLGLDAGDRPRQASIIVLPAPSGLPGGMPLALKNQTSGRLIPLQWRDSAALVFILDEPLEAGQIRTYRLKTGKKVPAGYRMRARAGAGELTVLAGDKEVLVYHTAVDMPPAGSPAYFRRSGYVHPVYSPAGRVITDGFPVGHTHQHGLFFAWTNTTYRDSFTDFWNQQLEKATVEFFALRDTLSGPVFARIGAEHRHNSTQFGPVLSEEWTMEAYACDGFFIIDLQSVQTNIGWDTLFINAYHYGGLGLRGSAEWNAVDSTHYTNPMQILTSEGRDRLAANHSRPVWTAMFGRIAGQTAGLAIFDHPRNFRHPQPIRVHPEMPYFCQAPMVEGPFFLAPGQPYVSRYRLVSFDGPPDAARLEVLYRDYEEPVRSRWQGKGKKFPEKPSNP